MLWFLLQVIDRNNGCQALYEFKAHTNVVRWCCFSQDGQRFASGSDDELVTVCKRRHNVTQLILSRD